MDRNVYTVRVKRRRGRWIAWIPALPSDSPRLDVGGLANVAPDMIVELSEYLGVDASLVAVNVPYPVRPARVPWRQRVSHGAAQALGGVIGLSGLYLAAGGAATLIATGIGVVAVAAGKEAGWL